MTGVIIVVPGSGSGRAIVACSLLTLLKREGYNPAALKCGPDYIDGLLRRGVLGMENGNLNSSLETGTRMRQELSQNMKGHFVVAEGVTGYFDGLGSVSLRGNPFEIGNILRLPAVLVVDGGETNLSLMALIQGLLEYDVMADAKNEGRSREKKTCEKEACNIRGIFFNHMSSMAYNHLKPMVEKQFQVPVIGYLPELRFLQMGSRHPGPVPLDEIDGVRGQLEQLTDQMDGNLEWESLLRIATDVDSYDKEASVRLETGMTSYFRLEVIRDEAFCFYYKDNLGAMEQVGAEFVYFSPFHQKELPKGLDGLILGGDYPKNHREALATDATMQDLVVAAADSGIPVPTECGGYLYLLDRLEGTDGAGYFMTGVLRGHEYRARRTGRLEHITLQPNRSFPFLQEGVEIKGHEFHYRDCGYGGDEFCMTTVKSNGGRYRFCTRMVKRTMTGSPHLYYPSYPELVQSFAERCMIYGRKREP